MCSYSVLGYNPVITIPAGATNVNITEIRRSKNYLGELLAYYSIVELNYPINHETTRSPNESRLSDALKFVYLYQADEEKISKEGYLEGRHFDFIHLNAED